MQKAVGDAFRDALSLMWDAGFEVSETVEVLVDERLPFMGYTTGRWNRHFIVVSGMAVKSDLLKGLLIHELSHIYRTEADHPSHNHKLLGAVISTFVEEHRLNSGLQTEILHRMVNHIQDLYADDIAFKVFRRNPNRLFPLDRMSDFFLSWIRDEPVKVEDRQSERWINASLILNNSFAVSNMERHRIRDIDGKAEEMNKRFLSKINPEAAEKFQFFKSFMVNLEEEISGEEFQRQLKEYLEETLNLIQLL